MTERKEGAAGEAGSTPAATPPTPDGPTPAKPAPARPAKAAPPWLTNAAAAFVAVAGALTAIFSFTLTETGNRALRMKSQALDRKTLAVQAWNEHQAVRTKQNIAELAVRLLPPDKAEPYRARLSRYSAEIAAAQDNARRLEADADRFDDRSEALLRPRQFQILALILLQISVTLGSITILAKSRTMLWLALLAGGGGTVLAIIGALSV